MSHSAEPGGGVHTITGAFGYSGGHIARRLLEKGEVVRTVTGHPERPHPLASRIQARRLQFQDLDALIEALKGTRVLYNTYWVRFRRGDRTHEGAVEDSRRLFEAARRAGVARVVHTSITNPSLDSPLSYFRGKAQVEEALQSSGMTYAILRPAVFFGGQDVLLNNIAWLLRRFPFIGVAGNGAYGLQPIHVEDFAELAVAEGQRTENVVRDAVGPEAPTYEAILREIGEAIGRRVRIVRMPRWAVLMASRVLGWMVRDRVLTSDELKGLMMNLLVTKGPPTGTTRFSQWARDNADTLGRTWASELGRHFR